MIDRPLIAYTIEQAIGSGLFEHVVVSTDSDQISEVARHYGAEVFFKRPPELASDTAAKLPVIRHAFTESEKHYRTHFDYLVDLDATSPLRIVEDIENSIELLVNGGYDNVVTAMPSRRSPYFNLIEHDKEGKVALSKSLAEINVVRRQDAPPCYDMNASIYVWKRDVILNSETVLTENTGLYVMPEERSIDIDSELDFKIVEMLLKERR